jgi:hypothetical protein
MELESEMEREDMAEMWFVLLLISIEKQLEGEAE